MNYFSLYQPVNIYFASTFLTTYTCSKHTSVLHLWSTWTKLVNTIWPALYVNAVFIHLYFDVKKPQNQN